MAVEEMIKKLTTTNGMADVLGFIDGSECVIFFTEVKLLVGGGKLVWIQIFPRAPEFLDEPRLTIQKRR